jgi:hypothetical protein
MKQVCLLLNHDVWYGSVNPLSISLLREVLSPTALITLLFKFGLLYSRMLDTNTDLQPLQTHSKQKMFT